MQTRWTCWWRRWDNFAWKSLHCRVPYENFVMLLRVMVPQSPQNNKPLCSQWKFHCMNTRNSINYGAAINVMVLIHTLHMVRSMIVGPHPVLDLMSPACQMMLKFQTDRMMLAKVQLKFQADYVMLQTNHVMPTKRHNMIRNRSLRKILPCSHPKDFVDHSHLAFRCSYFGKTSLSSTGNDCFVFFWSLLNGRWTKSSMLKKSAKPFEAVSRCCFWKQKTIYCTMFQLTLSYLQSLPNAKKNLFCFHQMVYLHSYSWHEATSMTWRDMTWNNMVFTAGWTMTWQTKVT